MTLGHRRLANFLFDDETSRLGGPGIVGGEDTGGLENSE